MERKRVILAMLLAIPLGGGTTLALAWSIAAFREMPMYPRPTIGAYSHWSKPWLHSESSVFGITDVWWQQLNESTADRPLPQDVREVVRIFRQRNTDLAASDNRTVRNVPQPWGTFTFTDPPPERYDGGSDTAYGWPLRCMWYQVVGEFPNNTIVNEQMHGGWLYRPGRAGPSCRLRDFRALPLLPIWPGLVGNTLFYAILWFALLLAPGVTRRSIRKRRGWCLSCGYDLSGSMHRGCPECGEGREARDQQK